MFLRLRVVMFPTYSYNDRRQRGKEEHNVNHVFHSHLCLLFFQEQLIPWLPRLNWLLVAAAAGCRLTGTSWSWGSSCCWWWWWGGGGPPYHDDQLKCDFQSLFHLSSIPQSSSSEQEVERNNEREHLQIIQLLRDPSKKVIFCQISYFLE